MAAKIKMGSIKTLATAMADNNDLTPQVNYGREVIEDPTLIGMDSEQPALPDEITALLIMAGATTRWNFNHWVVKNRKGIRSGVSASGTFEEWQSVLSNMAGDPA